MLKRSTNSYSSGSTAPTAAPEVAARCPNARLWYGAVGFFVYTAVGMFVTVSIIIAADAFGSDIPRMIPISVLASIPVVAVWRGATVSAAVRPGGVWVRNRWRQVEVPFSEIIDVEVRESLQYGLLSLAFNQWAWSNSYSALGIDMVYGPGALLMIRRQGHRNRLPVFATLGMTAHLDEVLVVYHVHVPQCQCWQLR